MKHACFLRQTALGIVGSMALSSAAYAQTVSFAPAKAPEELGLTWSLSVNDIDRDTVPEIIVSTHGERDELDNLKIYQLKDDSLTPVDTPITDECDVRFCHDAHGIGVIDLIGDPKPEILYTAGGDSGLAASADNVKRSTENRLYVASAEATSFQDQAHAHGLALPPLRGRMPAFYDFDNNGETDVFIGGDSIIEFSDHFLLNKSEQFSKCVSDTAPEMRVANYLTLLEAVTPTEALFLIGGYQTKTMILSVKYEDGDCRYSILSDMLSDYHSDLRDIAVGDFDNDGDRDLVTFRKTIRSELISATERDFRLRVYWREKWVDVVLHHDGRPFTVEVRPKVGVRPFEESDLQLPGAKPAAGAPMKISVDPTQLPKTAMTPCDDAAAPPLQLQNHKDRISILRVCGPLKRWAMLDFKSYAPLHPVMDYPFEEPSRSLDPVYHDRTGQTLSMRDAGLSIPEGLDCSRAAAADLNNDGWLDILAACEEGHAVSFLNNGAGAFTAQKHTFPAWHNATGLTGVAVGDMDADGDIDAAIIYGEGGVPRQPAPPLVLINQTQDAQKSPDWLAIKPIQDARLLGAEFILTSDKGRQSRVWSDGTHAFAQDEQIVHFGLGTKHDGADLDLEIKLRSGERKHFRLAPGQRHVLDVFAQ